MMNTIINFGDCLESHVLSSAEDNAEKSDMVLCLGTTLRVTPAADLVVLGKKPNRLVICNRYTLHFKKKCLLPATLLTQCLVPTPNILWPYLAQASLNSCLFPR